MNYIEYGKQRDNKIVELVTRGTAFTRTHIEKLLFNQKDATRKAQLRLQILTERGRLKKITRPHEPSVYYTRKRPRNLDHILEINDVYTAVMSQKKSIYTVKWQWSYPLMGGKLWADAMIDLKNQMTNRRHVIFVEVERYADHRFVKDKTYESIASMPWTNEEWAITESTRILFPAILIVTNTKLAIKSHLDFTVEPLDSLKHDVYSVLLRR